MRRRRRGLIPPWMRRWSSLAVMFLVMACCAAGSTIASTGQQAQVSIHLYQRTGRLRREHHQPTSHPPSAIEPLTELVVHQHPMEQPHHPYHHHHDPSSSSASDESIEEHSSSPHVRRPRHKLGTEIEIIGTLTGVAGGKLALPCNITPTIAKDSVSLILWYKDDSTTPIYSVDARKGQSLDAARRVTDENLASRAYMNTASRPYASLMLEMLTPEDAGEYACRVDFRKERTRNSVIFLKIIVPPEKPQIIDSSGEPQPSLIGPYTEGDRLTLVCEVEGGKPTPSLTWWRETVLLDDTFETVTTPSGAVIVRNQLVLPALQRHDLMAVFTCQASNNNISLPAATTVTVDLNFRPMSVKIVGERKPLSADKVSVVTCVSSGSRPPASITWWMGTSRLKHAEEQVSVDGNTTTSRLSLTVTVDDMDKVITCRAENSHIPGSAMEDSIKLDINYLPQVTLRLGSNLRHSHIQEGNDVYFECMLRASPWVNEVRWHFEGRELQTNTTAGVIVSNQSLVLQKVRRHQRGKYTCSATNDEGEGESNAIHLRVQFAPVCKPGQKIIYGAARDETVSVLCEVEADPPEVSFHWGYNGSSGISSAKKLESAALKFEPSGSLSSIGRYTPHSEFDYGTLQCWARNAVGSQSTACTYSIVAAGSPDPVRNCTVFNVTEDSMRLECDPGYDGGLLQHFYLELFDTTDQRSTSALRANLTGAAPAFHMTNLLAARTYLLVIYSANAKGRSKGIALTAYTLASPESMTRLAKGNVWQLNFNPVLVALVAVVTGVVLVAFLIVILVRWKTMKPSMQRYHRAAGGEKATENGAPGSSTSATTGSTTISSSTESSLGAGSANGGGTLKARKLKGAVFRKGLPDTIDDACDVCTDGGGSDDTTDHFKLPLPDLAPDISLTSSDAPNTKITELTEEEKLTTPLNGSLASTGSSVHHPGNIYTSSPLTNGSSAKHVTWRPDTPPSPPPNVYTPYSGISYVPVPTTTACLEPLSYQLVSETGQLVPATALPVSYSLSGGLDSGHMIAEHHPMPHNSSSYLMSQGTGPYGTLPYQNYAMGASYGAPPPPAVHQSHFSTLQHPRRVRVLPPGMSQGPMQGPTAHHVTASASGTKLADSLAHSPMTDV